MTRSELIFEAAVDALDHGWFAEALFLGWGEGRTLAIIAGGRLASGGASKIMAHLMFGVLALTVDLLLKLTG